ncbi:hypothetical protein EDD15DRAFT_2386343 [Pisolithus albus]|nr:hypothetical protein EDD15DRAFT_2386343 [Pisolithus albus]
MPSFPLLRSFKDNVDIIREWQSTMCPSALVTSPRDSIANFQYYGCAELPCEVADVFRIASTFNIMLVSMLPEETVQRFNHGNVTVLPQDPFNLHTVLPPSFDELRDSVCVVFSGGRFKPTIESLQSFHPVLVKKSNGCCLIEFLVSNNSWYRHEGMQFSQQNLDNLLSGEGDSAIFPGLQIHHLPSTDNDNGESVVDWSNAQQELIMENVAYTHGDHSECSRNAMKAHALAYAMDNKKFLLSLTGNSFMSDADPALMSSLFPHLDPWVSYRRLL